MAVKTIVYFLHAEDKTIFLSTLWHWLVAGNHHRKVVLYCIFFVWTVWIQACCKCNVYCIRGIPYIYSRWYACACYSKFSPPQNIVPCTGFYCICGSVPTVSIHVFMHSVFSDGHYTCGEVYRAQNFQGIFVWLAGVCPVIALVWYKYMDAW